MEHSPIIDGVGAVLVVVSLAVGLVAGAGLGRAAESGESETVRIASHCGTEAQTDSLVMEVRSRLPEVEVRRETGESEQAGVIWKENGDTGCELSVKADEETTRLSLPADADEASIRQAASRVAWLLTARRTIDRSKPDDGETSSHTEERERQEVSDEEEGSEDQLSETTDDETSDVSEEASSDDESEEDGNEQENAETQTEDGADPSTDEGGSNSRAWRPVPSHWTLVPPFAAPSFEEPVAPWFAMHLIGSHHGVRGVEIGVVNIKRDFARGLQMAGGANYVAGNVEGVQLALGGNVSRGNMTGVSSAIGLNIASAVTGLQVAGGANVATAGVEGVQLAFGANWAVDDVRGVQASMANVGGGVPGLQVGLLNISRQVDGVQIGLLNIARESDVSAGLLSVNWARPLYVSLWQDITGFSMLELKHGSRWIHNVVVGGYNAFTPVPTGAGGFGFGTRLGQRPLSLDIDALLMFATAGSPESDGGPASARWSQLRGTVQWSLFDRFAVTGGASLNVIFNDVTADRQLEPPSAIPSLQLDQYSWLWPGLHAGVRF